MARIFAFIAHKNGVADDTAAELAAAARKVDPVGSAVAIVVGRAPDIHAVCAALRNSYSEIWIVSNEALAYPNAELIRKALVKIVPAASIVLVAHEHFGIDRAPGLSIKLNSSYVPDVLAIESREGNALKVVRQEFGGMLSTHVRCDISSGAVLTIRPGAFKSLDTAPASCTVIDKSADVDALTARRRYLHTIAPETGAVDITKHALLVSIGRGIQEKDNVALAEGLAAELGAAVSCSRPVVDAKWLEKSRQVGSSGKTVKPKVYMACGISGSFQHLAGLKGNPYIIAINKNPKAPIFQVADIGIVDDILEFLPDMTEKVREMHSVSAK